VGASELAAELPPQGSDPSPVTLALPEVDHGAGRGAERRPQGDGAPTLAIASKPDVDPHLLDEAPLRRPTLEPRRPARRLIRHA
jgi:hypothetical protein